VIERCAGCGRCFHDRLSADGDAGDARSVIDDERLPQPVRQSWKQCVTMFTEELPWLPAQDKELIMGRALCAWLA
jgi:hypothetical protein